ncbi:MAG: hypothetical protein ACP5U1_06430 [Desulfomonilaceae bacterium]
MKKRFSACMMWILGLYMMFFLAFPHCSNAQMQQWLQEEQARQNFQKQQWLQWQREQQTRQMYDQQQQLQWQQQERARQMYRR